MRVSDLVIAFLDRFDVPQHVIIDGSGEQFIFNTDVELTDLELAKFALTELKAIPRKSVVADALNILTKLAI